MEQHAAHQAMVLLRVQVVVFAVIHVTAITPIMAKSVVLMWQMAA
jgi:hypothetical protein